MYSINDLSYKDFSVICRVCLKNGKLREFGKSGLLNLFEKITDIKIECGDSLPRNVCSVCISQLESISTFINLSKCNDATLKQILVNGKQEPDVDDCFVESDTVEDPGEYSNYSDDNKVEIKNEICRNPSESTDNIKTESDSSDECNKNYKKSIKHSTKKQPSECKICGKSFSLKSQLNEHRKNNTNCRIKQYKCMHCEKAFFTKYKLKLHMRSHTKETPYECKICFKKFSRSPNLKRHDDIVHKGLKPYKCDVCGKAFSRQATRNDHIHSHTGESPYICAYCGKSFQTYSRHFSHVYCHRLNNGEIPENKIKAKKINDSEVKCSICNKSFSSKSAVLQHIQLHGEKHFLCSVCGKAFLRKYQLEHHFKMHTGEKPHICKYCGKGFRLISSYKNHILIHTGEKPHQCKLCQKSFVQYMHLQRHMRIHTGEKPYTCSFCGRSFAQNCNLKVHIRTHTGDTPYRCEICGMSFHDSSNMNKHKKAHTNVDCKINIKEVELHYNG